MTSNSTTVAVVGASSIHGIANFGDQLLRELAKSWILAANPSADVRETTYRGPLLERSRRRAEIQMASALVFCGGGYFGQKPHAEESALRRFTKQHLWGYRNNDVYGFLARAAVEREIPCLVSGVEAGPVRNRRFRNAIRDLALHASFFSVRNEESAEFISDITDGRVRPDVYPDSALATKSVFPSSATSLEHDSDIPATCVRIGIHLHVPNLGASALTSALTTLKKILSESPYQYQIEYLYDQKREGKHIQSAMKAEELTRSIVEIDRSVEYNSPPSLVKKLAKCDLVVTTKLHVGIVARSYGVPVVSLATHSKTPRFYRSIHEAFRCTNLAQFAAEGFSDATVQEIAALKRGYRIAVNPHFPHKVSEGRSKFVSVLKQLLA